jgi:low temperature requirement protein LtrA
MLFLIIVLGEVIVATGITATELPVTAPRLAALVVCFGIAVLLWWLYFDFHAEHTVGVVALGAGPVIYLLGSVAFKIRILGALWQPRAIAAAVTVGAVALGSQLPAVVVWALVLGILLALAAVEARRTRDLFA